MQRDKNRIVNVFRNRNRDKSKPNESILASKIIYSEFGQPTTVGRLQAIEDRWRLKRKESPGYWVTEIRSVDASKRSKNKNDRDG